MSTPSPHRWPWYYHVILAVFCFAMSYFYTRLRPSHEAARVGGIVAGVVFLVSALIIQWQKRRDRSRRGDV